MKWTKAQQAAIETIGRDVLVTASAGTGKTAVLSHRVVERIAAFGQVDHQDVRACRHRKRLDRVAQTALVAFLGGPAELDHDRAQHVEGVLVADIGCKGIAVAGQARFE